MAPDAAVFLEHRQRLAQVAAGDAERLAQLAFSRQAAAGGRVRLGQIGLQLH